MVEPEGRPRLCGECLFFKTFFCHLAYTGQDLILATDHACPDFYPLASRWARFLRDRKALRERIKALKEAALTV